MFENVREMPGFVSLENLWASLGWMKKQILAYRINGNINNRFTLHNKETGESIEAQCTNVGGRYCIKPYSQPKVEVQNPDVFMGAMRTGVVVTK